MEHVLRVAFRFLVVTGYNSEDSDINESVHTYTCFGEETQ
jgi:hypothetical protein